MSSSCLMQVYRLRLLGDYHHSTRIAFVEFVMVIASSTLFIHTEFYILHNPSIAWLEEFSEEYLLG